MLLQTQSAVVRLIKLSQVKSDLPDWEKVLYFDLGRDRLTANHNAGEGPELNL